MVYKAVAYTTTQSSHHHGLQKGEQGMDTVGFVQSIIFTDAFNHTSIGNNLRKSKLTIFVSNIYYIMFQNLSYLF